jgi:hypothetical protein
MHHIPTFVMPTLFPKSIDEPLTMRVPGTKTAPTDCGPSRLSNSVEIVMSDRSRETSREEDYRDYEERDLDQGWPYADEDAARRAREAIDDDALEEEISDHFTDRDDIDDDQITVTVQHGVAKLSGTVETNIDAARAARIAAAVPGVRAVYNLLVPVGLDGHIPSDATD